MSHTTLQSINMTEIDKIKFISQYGSKKARKITVDEKLKL